MPKQQIEGTNTRRKTREKWVCPTHSYQAIFTQPWPPTQCNPLPNNMVDLAPSCSVPIPLSDILDTDQTEVESRRCFQQGSLGLSDK